MNASLNEQTILFLYSIFFGYFVGITYDYFRAFRIIFRTKWFGNIINDLFFWIINIVAFIIYLLNFANGEVRFYIILAIILGITLYFLTISQILLAFFKDIAKVIKIMVFDIFKLIKKIKKSFKNIFYFARKYSKIKVKNKKEKSNEKKKRKKRKNTK